MVLQSKRIGRFFMIGVYDYTVIATYLSLLLGLVLFMELLPGGLTIPPRKTSLSTPCCV